MEKEKKKKRKEKKRKRKKKEKKKRKKKEKKKEMSRPWIESDYYIKSSDKPASRRHISPNKGPISQTLSRRPSFLTRTPTHQTKTALDIHNYCHISGDGDNPSLPILRSCPTLRNSRQYSPAHFQFLKSPLHSTGARSPPGRQFPPPTSLQQVSRSSQRWGG